MATINPVNLTELLLNSTAEQAQESQAAAPSKANANNGSTAATGDQFTLSAQNAAQAAGLFTVNQVTLFSAAAAALLAQVGASPANPANTTANFAASPAAQESVAANTVAALPALAAATALATSATPNAPTANAAPATTASLEQQLQALNNALAALGLNTADIRKIDSVAGLINDFDPTAFTNLANQLEALARQQTASPTAANAPATANASAANATTANANTNASNANAANINVANAANTNPAALQIQELLIRFSGAGAPGAAGGTNSATGGTAAVIASNPNGPLPASTPNLEVELSLTDNNGHTVRVRAPAQAVSANPPPGGNQAPAQTGVATA